MSPFDRSDSSSARHRSIPGTVIFDGKLATMGYPLNAMCMSLNDPDAREAFKSDPAAYIDRFPLSIAQREAVLRRDWRSMLMNGGNIFFIFKIAIVDGLTMQHIAAAMCGMDIDDYRDMLRQGGRKPHG
jgi:protocatechuate 4,5-dioxygenase alpha chain